MALGVGIAFVACGLGRQARHWCTRAGHLPRSCILASGVQPLAQPRLRRKGQQADLAEGRKQGQGRARGAYRGSWGGPLCSIRLNSQVWLANWAYSSRPLMGFFSWHWASFL